MKYSTFILMAWTLASCSNGGRGNVESLATRPASIMTNSETIKINTDSLSGLKSDTDDVRNLVFYHDKDLNFYLDRTVMYAYIVHRLNDDHLSLRLKVQYHAEDWLFVRSYDFKCDDTVFHFVPQDIQTEVKYGIYEWSDDLVSGELCQIVTAVAASKKVKLRRNGTKYYDDQQVSEKQLASLRLMLQKFISSGGKLIASNS